MTHRKTGTKYAMKTVKLSGVKSQKAFEFVMKEVDLLKSLDHPNIVRLQVHMYVCHMQSVVRGVRRAIQDLGERATSLSRVLAFTACRVETAHEVCYCCCGYM